MPLITTILALLGFLTTQILARPSIDPSSPYKIVPIHWNVPTSPSGPNITVKGTIQDVVAQLTKENPNWKREFKPTQISGTPTHINKRDDWPWEPSPNLCAPNRNWGWAKMQVIREEIAMLRQQPGMPFLGPGPGTCGRVSCLRKAAIWWCNDLSYDRVEADYAYLADGAQRIYDKCQKNDGGGMTKGQIFNKDWFNVIVWFDDRC